jgi:hypothetical protein
VDPHDAVAWRIDHLAALGNLVVEAGIKIVRPGLALLRRRSIQCGAWGSPDHDRLEQDRVIVVQGGIRIHIDVSSLAALPGLQERRIWQKPLSDWEVGDLFRGRASRNSERHGQSQEGSASNAMERFVHGLFLSIGNRIPPAKKR